MHQKPLWDTMRNFYSYSYLITKSERSQIKNFMMYHKLSEKQEQMKSILANGKK